MSQANDKTSIWHDTAIKLIRYAKKHNSTSNEFERQVGYLLLDVGVETLFRSYLTMPDTKSKLSFTKREEAAKGTIDKKDIMGEKFTFASFDELSFHKLVEAVGKVAEPSIDESILKEVEYYHNIRNKIYHLGEGIVPAKEKFEGYLQLADKLLILLVDRKTQEEKAASHDDLDEALRTLDHIWNLSFLRKDFQEFKLVISAAAEAVNPKYTTRKIEEGLKELTLDEDIDTSCDDIEEKYDTQQIKRKDFQKLTGIVTENVRFIDDVIYDITYLYLLVLLKNKKIESEDLNKYLEYRELVEKISKDPDEATMKDKEKLGQILDWARTIQTKLYALYDVQTPNRPQSL